LVVVLVYLITFFFPNWIFAVLAALFIGFGLHEYFGMVERKGIFVYKHFGIIVGMTVPIIIYLQRGVEGYVDLDPFLIVLACLFVFILHFTRRDSSQALASIAVTMMGLLYIGWFFSFFVKLKFLPDGERLVAYLIVVTKSNDIGAYFAGRRFGRHPLIPRISPAKTVEGTIGGFLSGLAASVICKTFLPSFSYMHLVILGVLLGTLGQTGDLAESLLKRDCGVKDAGTNLSGFGGVLDLIDSLIFTTPIFYFYVIMVVK
jgi:phosphatidate cytidylyltransferase